LIKRVWKPLTPNGEVFIAHRPARSVEPGRAPLPAALYAAR
jgi:hypothetical protein